MYLGDDSYILIEAPRPQGSTSQHCIISFILCPYKAGLAGHVPANNKFRYKLSYWSLNFVPCRGQTLYILPAFLVGDPNSYFFQNRLIDLSCLRSEGFFNPRDSFHPLWKPQKHSSIFLTPLIESTEISEKIQKSLKSRESAVVFQCSPTEMLTKNLVFNKNLLSYVNRVNRI